MNQPSNFSLKRIIILALAPVAFLTWESAAAQTVLTIEESITIAKTSSPDIQKSMLNLLSNRKSLDAQRASLKSRFALDVTPIDFSRSRVFNDFFSTWNTTEDYNSSANFSVSQPITATDGRISLNNRLGYRDNFSEAQDLRTKTYSNNLFLQLDQPCSY